MHLRLPVRPTDRASRGQSLVEFALVLPLILLLTVIALDFGRVYLGYINLQNMARIAANYAANNPSAPWSTPSDTRVAAYLNRISNDARATNCTLPADWNADPSLWTVFTDAGGNGTSTDVGDRVSVSLTCSFQIITPIISSIVGSGGSLPVSASAVFPIKTGMIATGGGITIAPTAAFTGSPVNGPAPLVVQFTDQSTDNPTSWAWDFESDGILDSTSQDPTHTYANPGTYTVTLVATNDAGSGTVVRNNYVTVGVPVATVSFTATPNTGTQPLVVQFTDTSTNSPTAWEWDFNNDGTVDNTTQNPTWTYTAAGSYSVRLTVTNAGGDSSTLVADLITVSVGNCTVPNFAGLSTTAAQAWWESHGFTSTVNFQQGNRPWTIASQNQVVGISIPCNSPITVSKN